MKASSMRTGPASRSSQRKPARIARTTAAATRSDRPVSQFKSAPKLHTGNEGKMSPDQFDGCVPLPVEREPVHDIAVEEETFIAGAKTEDDGQRRCHHQPGGFDRQIGSVGARADEK